MKFTFGARRGHSTFLTSAAVAVNNSKNKKGYHLPHTLLHARCYAKCLTCINLFSPRNDPMKGDIIVTQFIADLQDREGGRVREDSPRKTGP